jgi:transcriptional regulator with XRE-family HTH domain
MKPITDDQKKRAAEIAQRIDVLTKTLGMQKGEFYKKANITSANFSYWRKGLNYPSRKKLSDAAKALNVTVAYLEYGDDSAQQEKPTAQGDGLKLDSYEDIDQWLGTLDGKGLDMVIALAIAKKVKNNEDKP